jgi:hypothetical protein
MDGKTDQSNRGFISVQLSASTSTQTAADAVNNARGDIERSGIAESVATSAYSKLVQATAVAVGLDPQNSAFLKALGNVLSKLDVFVRIIDKTSQVRIVMLDILDRFLTVRLEVHPYANFAWQVVSSLYKVPRKVEIRLGTSV